MGKNGIGHLLFLVASNGLLSNDGIVGRPGSFEVNTLA